MTKATPMLSSAYIAQPVGGFMLALRMCILGLGLALVSYLYFSTEELADLQGQTLFVVIAILFGISAISGFSIINRRYSRWINVAELLVDSSVITGIIYISGGPVSPLLFAYLPFLIVVTFTAGRSLGLVVMGLSISLYSLLVYALNHKWLTAFNDYFNYQMPAEAVLWQVGGLFFSMFLVVIAADYLRNRIAVSSSAANSSLSLLERVRAQQHALFDEIPSGLVLLDQDLRVLQLNRTSQNILSSYSSRLIGADFDLIWKTLTGTTWSAWQDELNNKPTMEISYCDIGSKQSVNLLVACKQIILNANEPVGTLVLMQDVTQLRALELQLAAQDQISQLLSAPSKPQVLKSSELDKFVGESPAMQLVIDSVRKLTNSMANVLITGDSGTAQELIAKALHYERVLAPKPFVAVNCGAIPADLIESQLFGHKKGSFTGASTDHKGFFEQANGGTIFLDEIGELPLNLQTKLLRVIQERVIRPVGAEKDQAVNVRIVSATNRDLSRDVINGKFREDLLYRINVVNLVLPALRERRDDIPLLVKGILRKLVGQQQDLPVVSPAALKLLLEYNYPGNIRELENILERAYVFNQQVILPENLTIEKGINPMRGAETQILQLDQMLLPTELDKILGEVERRYLETAIQRSNGSKKQAAELLGINFRSIRYRLDKFGIASDSKE